MSTFEQVWEEITNLVRSGYFAQAEQQIDNLAEMDSDELETMWGLQSGQGNHNLSVLYNYIGLRYQDLAAFSVQQNQSKQVVRIMEDAERCHEKAWDMYDFSPEDVVYLPSNSPFNKNLLCTLAGLGRTKFLLRKFAESRKFLLLCTRITATDEQAAGWQSEAALMLEAMSE